VQVHLGVSTPLGVSTGSQVLLIWVSTGSASAFRSVNRKCKCYLECQPV